VRRWQNELRATVGYDTAMACRSLLYRILQAAEDDRRIEANPVRKVPAPKPPIDPVALLGRAKRRAYTPEEFGVLLAGTPPFYRDHFVVTVGTGLRAGELLGLRARRVDLDRRQLEVVEVRYDAGRFGSGYKNRPKTPASIRVVPLAGPVVNAIRRRLPPDGDPDGLVFTGPGGSNHLPRGARSAMSRHGLLRVYKHALVRVADPVASCHTRRDGCWPRCATADRRRSSKSVSACAGAPHGRRPSWVPSTGCAPSGWPLRTRRAGGPPATRLDRTTCWDSCACEARMTFGIPSRRGWKTPASPSG
jgi:integrase